MSFLPSLSIESSVVNWYLEDPSGGSSTPFTIGPVPDKVVEDAPKEITA